MLSRQGEPWFEIGSIGPLELLERSVCQEFKACAQNGPEILKLGIDGRAGLQGTLKISPP